MPVNVNIATPLRENDLLKIVPSITGGTTLRCICS